jgi:hypothetical protein
MVVYTPPKKASKQQTLPRANELAVTHLYSVVFISIPATNATSLNEKIDLA